MPIKIFIDYISQPARAVYALALLGKFPHEIIETRVNRKEHLQEQYGRINPLRKVPAILDPQTNFSMGESHAIMRYLVERYPEHLQAWYPKHNLQKRAKIDQYLDFHHTNTRKCHILISGVLSPKKTGILDPYFNQQKAEKDVESLLKTFTHIFLKEKPFLMGEEPTIADLSAYYQIQFLMLLGEDFSQWNSIHGWLGRMGKIREVRQANKSFIKIMAKRSPSVIL